MPRWRAHSHALTKREREVLCRLAHGKSDGEIAKALGIAYSTERQHVESIYCKLEVHKRGQAADWYWAQAQG